MSHSMDVYENNYMSECVCDDLIKHRFGAFVGTNDPFFDLLRDLSMQNDPGAPLDATLSRREKYKTLQKSRAKAEMSRAKALLESLRQRLYALVVEESRKKYFAEAAKRRSQGLSTSHLVRNAPASASPYTTQSPQEWSNHMETVYGKTFALYLTNDLSSDCAAAQDCAVAHGCFVCRDSLPASRAGAIEYYSQHTAALSSGELFVCLECVSSEVEGAKSTSYSGNEMLYHLDFKAGPERKRARVSAYLKGVSGLSTDEAGAGKNLHDVIDNVKDDIIDDSLDYLYCGSCSASSTSPGLDTPRTECSSMDTSVEPILGEDSMDYTILSYELDMLLKKESPGPLASKDDLGDMLVCPDNRYTGPKDGNNNVTTDPSIDPNLDICLDMDYVLDMDYTHLVQLDAMDFAQPPQEEDLRGWDDEEWEGFSD
ncbi:MAG: hypothetical protein Q9163_004647 [Psora crenata]